MPCIYNLKPEDRYCNYCSAVCDERPIEEQAITTTNTMREVYAQGYRKAEKDLALTWEDIAVIITLYEAGIDNGDYRRYNEAEWMKEYSQDILRRFNEQREKK